MEATRTAVTRIDGMWDAETRRMRHAIRRALTLIRVSRMIKIDDDGHFV